ncbi:MAG: nucleotidyltransferase domain-containing protein [Acidobacteriaceae bacterium]
MEIDQRTVVDEALIQDVTQRIMENFHPKNIILFGSHARGDAGADSDLDLIVVMNSEKPFVERNLAVRRLFGLRHWSMDLVVYTPEEFERGLHTIGHLPSMIAREMRVLYGS